MRSPAFIACVALLACGSDNTPSGGADAPTSAGAAPVIHSISWAHHRPCTAGIADQVTITVDATDSDTPGGNLTYSGGWPSCSPAVSGATTTITCPEVSTYAGTVSVKDPENHSASQHGMIMTCVDGHAP
jgi:hypothetical protein